MVFLIFYILLSILISYFLSFFAKRKLFKISIFSLSLSLLCSFWFTYPGSNDLAPILSIFFLELFVLPENGILRLLRPFFATFVVFFLLTLSINRFKSKN